MAWVSEQQQCEVEESVEEEAQKMYRRHCRAAWSAAKAWDKPAL